MADETYRRYHSGRYGEEQPTMPSEASPMETGGPTYYDKLQTLKEDPTKSEARKLLEGGIMGAQESLKQAADYLVPTRHKSKRALFKEGEE